MPSSVGNFFVKTIVTSRLHALLGDSFAVITLTGRKTGRLFSTPVNVIRQDDGWIVVSMRSRTWWRNLRGGRTAVLHIGGLRVEVCGEVLEDHDQVAAGLGDYFGQHPGYAKYFDIRLNEAGKPDPNDIHRLADERIIVRLHPS